MKEICPHEKCVGCKVCMSACRHDAIEITHDSLGFEYPRINPDKCVSCMACLKACPVNNEPIKIFPTACYAVVVKDDAELMRCASGGMATYLASHIINSGGVVYGASNEDIRAVRHVRIDSIDELDQFRGSKYVQSDMAGVARQVECDLKEGKKVLFTGTPCQVAGIRSFLKKEYDNLITADLVCHGVPSQRLLNDNIDAYTRAGHDIDLKTLRFREKFLHRTGCASIQFGWFFRTNRTGVLRRTLSAKDPYMCGFESGLFYRESCYKCSYSYSSRIGDITLCDFWGLGPLPEYKHGKGVSAVLVNTERGKTLLESLDRSGIVIVEREVQEAICGNGNLMRPSVKNPQRDNFANLYPKLGWSKTTKICLKPTRRRLLLMNMLRKLKKIAGI